VIRKPEILERAEDFNNARVMRVLLRDKRKEKPSIEEGHAFWAP
jgi:hypothetical protein